jgi:cell fate regulator YaaT (PSP1 superfamily)
MRPVTAIVPLDRDTVVITFAAEERVDFRELLRDLGRRTRRRVELRQIGVRDQAKASGGWGPCGRTLCCSTFMARFNSVTIRMAKAQRLSLNPSRISGMCGRLMCCLAHEAGEADTTKRPAAAK